jgi:hypothetical protein
MEEQDDLKKQAEVILPEIFRRMKQPTNGPIPDVVRKSDGHMYIVREFKKEMRGKKIPDDMVVRAENGRWFTKNEVENFVMKSTPRCPTYGVCRHCFSSGPVHMWCQICRNKHEIYMIPERNGKFLDAEWISRFFGTSHLDVSIQFAQRPDFPTGMKILLPETIYPNPSAVCFVFPLASRVAV